jgi:hypothetical protein
VRRDQLWKQQNEHDRLENRRHFFEKAIPLRYRVNQLTGAGLIIAGFGLLLLKAG